MTTDLATRLSDEADLCRNDGADDIARLLDEAAAALRQPGPTEMQAEFTDTSRDALAWVLWHHQGGSSPVGQPIRLALGLGAHDELPGHMVAGAKRWAATTGSTTADFHRALAAPAEPVAVPEIDYTRLIHDCYRTTKAAQGTRGCVQFKLGAEWFREQVLAASPAAPAALPLDEQATDTAFPFRVGQRKLVRKGHAQGLLRGVEKNMRIGGFGDPEAMALVAAYIDMLEAAPAAPAASAEPVGPETARLTIEEINALPSAKGRWWPAGLNDVLVRLLREAAEAGAAKALAVYRAQRAAPAPAEGHYSVPEIEPTVEAIRAVVPTANPDEYACCVGADMWNACRKAMLAAQAGATPAAPAAQAWQPIETAPKDGTRVLVYCRYAGRLVAGAEWRHSEPRAIQWEAVNGVIVTPTHWMPLPAAPAGISQGGE